MSALPQLRELLERHAPNAVVSMSTARGSRSAADLLRDADTIAAALSEARHASGAIDPVMLVFRHDRYAFAAALLATWQQGCEAVLPPNTRRETVWTLRDQGPAKLILHDTRSGEPTLVSELLAPQSLGVGGAEAFAPRSRPRSGRATVYTSGSTGEMSAWPKTPAQLLGEACMQADALGIGPGSCVVATVPPGHIYGLLFSVLAPLVSGAAFEASSPLHAPTVAERVQACAADTLVVVPAHVRALVELPAGALAGVQRVICSTAPLDETLALAFADRHGVAITEVLGSTETGGIARRQRTAGASWRPLPGVSLSAGQDGRLEVRSPFADVSSAARSASVVSTLPSVLTSDLARFNDDGSFEHLGRVDGIVKIGGQRVSIVGVQTALASLPGVTDAAVVAAPDPTGRGKRLLAALVCDANTWTPAAIKAALADRFELSTLPRRVVFCDRLPREDNGKLPHIALLRLFGLDTNGQPIAWDLEWQTPTWSESAVEDGEHTYEVTARVPDNFGWYDGHFPGYPILAGAVQLRDIALRCMREAWPDLGDVQRVSKLKFLGRIQPGQTISVVLSKRNNTTDVDFRIMRDHETCSAGRVQFHAEGGS